MKERIIPMFFFALVSIVCFPAEPAKSAGASDGWNLATERNGVTIYTRPHSGSPLKEFKAVGEIAAPSRAVCEVIEDVDAYPSFMPYMAECRLLRRESDSLLSYQRISPKICSDRDFTLRTYKTSWPGVAGLVYSNRWESANALGPPKKPGVVRVEFCQGSWLLEPSGAARTRATYSVYTDTGGLVHHLSPITLARAGSGRFSPPCVNRYRNQNTTRPLNPHRVARAETESRFIAQAPGSLLFALGSRALLGEWSASCS